MSNRGASSFDDPDFNKAAVAILDEDHDPWSFMFIPDLNVRKKGYNLTLTDVGIDPGTDFINKNPFSQPVLRNFNQNQDIQKRLQTVSDNQMSLNKALKGAETGALNRVSGGPRTL